MGEDTLHYTLSRAEGENAGTYAITATLGDNPNYAVTVTDGTLTITKKNVTLTIDNKNKVYGSADPAFTATPQGLVGEDALHYTLSREAGENAGTYAITAALGDNPNYEVAVTPGKLEITAKAITLTITDKDKTYGDPDPAFGGTVTGLVGDDTLTYTLSREPGENAGTYDITANVTADPNYKVTVDDGTMTIAPKAVTITVDNKTKTRGNADPTLSATVTGLVGNDTIAYTLSRVAGEGAGTYAITATYTPNGNYKVSVINGTLTINAAPVNPTPTPTIAPTSTPANPTPTPTTTIIPNPEVPQSGGGASWALLNLILAIGTALASIGLLIGYFRKKKEKSEEAEQKRKGLMRVFSLVPAIGAVVAFILTENMKNPMAFTDVWTLLMAGIAIVQGVVMYLSRKNSEEADKADVQKA